MTTPQQRQIFNPLSFGNPASTQNQVQQKQNQEQKEYPTVEDATRNQKCKDSKSKQYRDTSRAVQIKVKGPRFEQLRTELRLGNITSEQLCSDEGIPTISNQQELKQVTQQPLSMPPVISSGIQGGQFRPPGPPGGQMIRPRPMGGPMFRPPTTRPPMPQQLGFQIQQQKEPEIQQPYNQLNQLELKQQIDNIEKQDQQQVIAKDQHQKEHQINNQKSEEINQQADIKEGQLMPKMGGEKLLKKAESEFISSQDQSKPVRPMETRSESGVSIAPPKSDSSIQNKAQPKVQPPPPQINKEKPNQQSIVKQIQQLAEKSQQQLQPIQQIQQEDYQTDETELQRQKAWELFNKELESMEINIEPTINEDSKDQIKKPKKGKKKQAAKGLKKDKKKDNKKNTVKNQEEKIAESPGQNQDSSIIQENQNNQQDTEEQQDNQDVTNELKPVQQHSETRPRQQSRKVSEDDFKYLTTTNSLQHQPQILTSYNAFSEDSQNQSSQQQQQLNQLQAHNQAHENDHLLEGEQESVVITSINNNNNQITDISGFGEHNNQDERLEQHQKTDKIDSIINNQNQEEIHRNNNNNNDLDHLLNDQQQLQQQQFIFEHHQTQDIFLHHQHHQNREVEEQKQQINILNDEDSPNNDLKSISSFKQIDNAHPFSQNILEPTNSNQQLNLEQISHNHQIEEVSGNISREGRAKSVKSLTSFSQQNLENENAKRLQESLMTQKEQNKEVKERLILIENDSILQGKKASLVMEENKQLRDEIKKLQKDANNKRMNDEQALKQAIAQIKRLEVENKEKVHEVESIQRELQRVRDEKDNYKEKFNSCLQESQTHREQLDQLVKVLQGRQFNSAGHQHQLQSNDNLASNQQEQIENVQKEMNEMKQHYENLLRDKNQDLSNKQKDVQRLERLKTELQLSNNSLTDNVSQLRNQVISTMAGSGSNQRDTQSMLNSQRRNQQQLLFGGLGGGFNVAHEHEEEDGDVIRLHNVVEDEGTGGDGYNQTYQTRNQNYQNFDYGYMEEGAVAVGGIGEEEEGYDYNEDDNNLRGRGNAAGTQQINVGSGQQDEVSEQNDEEEDDMEDEDEEDDYEYEGEFEQDGGDDDFEDGSGGNDYDNNVAGQTQSQNRQTHSEREGGATMSMRFGGGSSGQTHQQQQQFSTNMQIEEGGVNEISLFAAGGQVNQNAAQRSSNEERKQNQQQQQRAHKRRRRGNKQQNQQQHNNMGGSSNTQNPTQSIRTTRGRQQRSNQQHLTQQANPIGQQQQQQQNEVGLFVPPTTQNSLFGHRQQIGGGGSSQNNQNQSSTQQDHQPYGDSSSILQFARSNDDQSSNIPPTNNPQSHQSLPSQMHNQYNVAGSGMPSSQRDQMLGGVGIAGPSVVHTAGRGAGQYNNMASVESMAESGATASFLDKKTQNIHHLTQFRPQQQQLQSQFQASLFQTGSNNNQFNAINEHQPQMTSEQLFFGSDQDIIGAAVGAPTQNKAAAQARIKQQQQQTQSQQQQQQQMNIVGSNNQQHMGSILQVEESKQSSSDHPSSLYHNNNNNNNNNNKSSSSNQQLLQSSGSGIASSVRNNNSLPNYFMGESGEQEEDSSSNFYSSLGNQNAVNFIQQQQQYSNPHSQGMDSAKNQHPNNKSRGNLQQQHHQEQSSTPTRNDSRKTSGANTPNKDGADTPTTKIQQNQQQHRTIVHNLTSNQLFFSNQDENEGVGQGHAQQQQQQHQSNFDQIPQSMFD